MSKPKKAPRINIIGFSLAEPLYSDLKTDFLKISSEYENKRLNLLNVEELRIKYENLFNHFKLYEFQWRLIKDENGYILFMPLRVVDIYILKGIMS